MKVLEKDIQRTIIDFFEATGWLVIRNVTYSQTVYATKGIPDLTCVKKGRTIWVEIKKPGGKQSPNQINFESALKRVGGEYLLADSLAVLREYLEGK